MDFNNQRPGVYSRYDVSAAYVSPRSARCAAVVAAAAPGAPGGVTAVDSLAALRESFAPDGPDETLYGCAEILLKSGVRRVLAVPAAGDYAAALALVEHADDVGAVVCDAPPEDLHLLRRSVTDSADALLERLGYCGVADPAAAVAAAGDLNCERVVLCCPAVAPAGRHGGAAAYGAAAVAGMVLGQGDCTHNFTGEALPGVEGPARLPETQVQALLAAGVTLLETVGGGVECVRAMTTRTRQGGETDYALRGLNTVLCIDDVMGDLRAALRATLRSTRLTGRALPTIQSQAALVLAQKRDSGVLEDFASPRVSTDPADPSVCVVELGFHVAQVVQQIHVTAHIQV